MLENKARKAISGPEAPLQVDLSCFDNSDFQRGASTACELAWIAARSAFFESGPVPLSFVRRWLLLQFGATVGTAVTIRRGARVTFPWKLKVGDNCWIGEDCWLLNLAEIELGRNVVISQRAFLCTGNHDWSDPAFRLCARSIVVEDGVWIGASAFVGPGVRIGSHAVVAAGSVVSQDLPPFTICAGNPCVPLKTRKLRTT